MNLGDLIERPGAWMTWLGGLLCVLFGIGAVAVIWGAIDVGPETEESPVYIEEFRVAEPLADDPSSAIRDQLETISAVTEPYDDVEAAVDEEREERAKTDARLELQCATVLKEIAFCTDDDLFLEIIGEASTLKTDGEREQFMGRVQDWFEPDGARRYCEAFLEQSSSDNRGGKEMWRESVEATDQVCEEFGTVLVGTEIFEVLGPFWSERSRKKRVR